MSEESVTEPMHTRQPPPAPLRARLRAGVAALAELPETATALCPGGSLPPWLRPVLAGLGPDALRVVTVSRADRVVGLWLLELRWVGPLRVACRVGCGLLPYDGLRLDPHEDPIPIVQAAWQAVVEARCADLIRLEALPEGDPLLALPALAAALRPTDRASVVDLAPYATPAAYLASRSKNRRRSLRRRREQMAELGTVEVCVLTDPAARRQAMAQALDFKARWLVAEGRLGLSLSEGRLQSTLLALAEDPATIDTVPILCLRLNGRLAAVEVGLVEGGTCLSYLGAYEPDFARLGVGAALTLEAIGWCIAQGLSRYDLLPPATDFKSDWADRHPTVLGGLVPLSRRGRMAAPLLTNGHAAAKARFEALPPPTRDALRTLVTRLRR